MGADEEPNRLRALLALMREAGMTKLVTPDGYVLERPPVSPLEAALAAGESKKAGATSKDDVDEDLDAEEESEKDLKARWIEHWSRLTLSSGAGVPAFPGPKIALRVMGPS